MNRSIYPLLAAPTVPHKLPAEKLSRGERQPEPYISEVKQRSSQPDSTDTARDMLVALTQSRAALSGWAHTLKHSTKTWGTEQHQTGRFSASFWKHHKLSGLARRNTVNKKSAFCVCFFFFRWMVTAEDSFAEHQVQHTHVASLPLLTANTRTEQESLLQWLVQWHECPAPHSSWVLTLASLPLPLATGLAHDSDRWTLIEHHFLLLSD